MSLGSRVKMLETQDGWGGTLRKEGWGAWGRKGVGFQVLLRQEGAQRLGCCVREGAGLPDSWV